MKWRCARCSRELPFEADRPCHCGCWWVDMTDDGDPSLFERSPVVADYELGWAAGVRESAAWLEDAMDRVPHGSQEQWWLRGAVHFLRELVSGKNPPPLGGIEVNGRNADPAG